MDGQALETHIDDHPEAKPENAEQDADHQQPATIDHSLQKADLRQVGQLQRRFAARRLACWLSQSRDGAESEERGQGRNLSQ